jgi:hypothetical protein
MSVAKKATKKFKEALEQNEEAYEWEPEKGLDSVSVDKNGAHVYVY